MSDAPPEKEKHPYESLLGDALITKDGGYTDVLTSTLTTKRVGLYFSAHWCPPCRGFTPELVEFYEDLKETDPSALEIVFVSSDHDVAEFNAYFGEMPWLALPYADRARKDQLAKHFQVASIPCLVFLNPDGSILTKRGRDMVSGNPNGFPWVRK